MTFNVQEIAHNSNYIWALIDGADCVIVDPASAKPVQQFLNKNNLTLRAILITHHHHDHTAGLPDLSNLTNQIYGPKKSSIPHITTPLAHNDTFTLGQHVYTVFHTPGHTLDHISIYTDNHLFCGDVLFSGGCGRLFEGSAQQLFDSIQCLLNLPEDTNLYCGHEYTLQNLEFALTIEPDNTDLQTYYSVVKNKRQNQQATLPSTLKTEKKVNPFCRCDQPTVQKSIRNKTGISPQSPLETFSLLRQLKDTF